MLTRDDLEQIRGVIREEVCSVIHDEVRGIVREEVSVQLKPINRTLTHLRRSMNFIMKDYTNAIVHVRNRVERIEDHLNLPQM